MALQQYGLAFEVTDPDRVALLWWDQPLYEVTPEFMTVAALEHLKEMSVSPTFHIRTDLTSDDEVITSIFEKVLQESKKYDRNDFFLFSDMMEPLDARIYGPFEPDEITRYYLKAYVEFLKVNLGRYLKEQISQINSQMTAYAGFNNLQAVKVIQNMPVSVKVDAKYTPRATIKITIDLIFDASDIEQLSFWYATADGPFSALLGLERIVAYQDYNFFKKFGLMAINDVASTDIRSVSGGKVVLSRSNEFNLEVWEI